jgi:hypothetical protein
MLTTPAFAASVAGSSDTPTARTEAHAKATKTSDKGLKKHRVHTRTSHGHKVHYARHAKQVKHSHQIPKKSTTSASRKSDAKTTAVAPVQAPAKN